MDVEELFADLLGEHEGQTPLQGRAAVTASGPHEEPSAVQRLLQERNKTLSDEVTSLKWRLSELEAASEALEADLGSVRAEVEEKNSLIFKLEKDLELALSAGRASWGDSEAATGTQTKVAPPN